MFPMKLFWIGMVAIWSQTGHVASHGRLIQPAQRSSAWRFGYDNPDNYNDNELFCGGFAVQYNSVNKGRCGVCGDPYSATVKPNEDADGRYVKNGVITGNYVKGDVMTTKVDITANHKGWFEFRLCPLETPTTVVTQECLDQNLLKVAGSDTTRVILSSVKKGTGVEIFEIDLQLPDNITCERCVLQWKYNTGNSWGCDAGGCALGRGNQENFVNCADIRINDVIQKPSTTKSSSSSSQSATMTALTSSTTVESSTSTTVSIPTTATTSSPTSSTASSTTTSSMTSQTTSSTTSQTTSSPTTSSTMSKTTSSPSTSSTTSQTTSLPTPTASSTTSKTTSLPTPTTSSTTSNTTSLSTTTKTVSTTTETPKSEKEFLVCSKKLTCRAVKPYSATPGMPKWCCDNCTKGFCPKTHCLCS